ncbi:hypothetical protein ABH922_000643 [Rhodococcus sp. 27YEA15]|uniref:VOC family protein n=1 Tax=Rhodococcus sp. 27YEA15 TaxID=3156259 RepID=UPI003C7CF1FC
MKTEGIEAVFLETHNWGKSAKFLQALGFEVEFETGHGSGQLRGRVGPPVFVAEVPAEQDTTTLLVLKADNEDAPDDSTVEVVTPFADTHYGTREMTVRDPDGRIWSIQTPAAG